MVGQVRVLFARIHFLFYNHTLCKNNVDGEGRMIQCLSFL